MFGMSGFYKDVGDLNSGPPVCTVGAVFTKPSLQTLRLPLSTKSEECWRLEALEESLCGRKLLFMDRKAVEQDVGSSILVGMGQSQRLSWLFCSLWGMGRCSVTLMQLAEEGLPVCVWKLTLISFKSPRDYVSSQVERKCGRHPQNSEKCCMPHQESLNIHQQHPQGSPGHGWEAVGRSDRSSFQSSWYSAFGDCCCPTAFFWPGAWRNMPWLTASATALYYLCSQTGPLQVNLELWTQGSRQEVCKWWTMNPGCRLTPTEV